MTNPPTSRSEAEAPLIAIRMGLGRDPASWMLLAVRGIGYLTVLIFAGIVVGRVPCAGVALLFFLAMATPWFAREWLLVDRSHYSFHVDRVDVESRLPDAPRRSMSLAYDELTHLELSSMKRIDLTFMVDGDAATRTLNVDSRIGEDLFDEILDIVQQAVPDHLFSIREHGRLRLSDHCTAQQLFPDDTAPVTRVEARGPDIRAGSFSYAVDGPSVRRRADQATVELFRSRKECVMLPNGMWIGAVSSPDYRHLLVELITEEVFSIDGLGGDLRGDANRTHSLGDIGVVHRGGTRLGRLIPRPGLCVFELTEELPAIVAVILFATFLAHRSGLRV